MSSSRSLFLFLLLAVTAATTYAQEARPLVVMNLAAHPDDEDGRTLTYYRHAKDAATYSVIFTRGEGGQNEIGPELYEALGAIRTEETERAARRLGTQVYFLNFEDFGYSKHAAEAFERWGGRDAVTARLVYLIRKLKPDVLFTNHDTVTVGPRRQHGQHQAVGISGYDAFTLAADPAYHPEQLKEIGIDLWQPSRLFLRQRSNNEADDVAVPVGDPNPETGQPYYTLALDALREHASQGMGLFAGRNQPPTTAFTLLRTATDAPLDTADLAGNLPPNTAAHPDLSYGIDAGRLPNLPPGTLTLTDSLAVPGQRLRLLWDVDRLPTRRIRWTFRGAVDTTIYLSDTSPGIATLRVLPEVMPTVPKPLYQYNRFVNHPPVTYALYRAGTEELLAAGYLPLEVAPPLMITAEQEVTRLRGGRNLLPLRVTAFTPDAESVTVNVAVSRDADRHVMLHRQTTVALDAAGTAQPVLELLLPDTLTAGDYTITATALPNAGMGRPVPATRHLPARVFEVAVPPGFRVGVVRSYDNTLEQALEELGVDYELLDSLDLATADFSDLHTVVVDIRAYLVRPDLRAHNDRLLAWVEAGGHLIVTYQKTFEWNEGYDDPFVTGRKNEGTFAPFPLRLGRGRVTREDAPVTVLLPDHPFFHTPNLIKAEDWDGWLQERGLYFPETYDPRYQEVLSLGDPGEAAQTGSTLLAKAGRGTYLYTALGWYRQLKVYHPGTYALFANLISLPLVDGR